MLYERPRRNQNQNKEHKKAGAHKVGNRVCRIEVWEFGGGMGRVGKLPIEHQVVRV